MTGIYLDFLYCIIEILFVNYLFIVCHVRKCVGARCKQRTATDEEHLRTVQVSDTLRLCVMHCLGLSVNGMFCVVLGLCVVPDSL